MKSHHTLALSLITLLSISCVNKIAEDEIFPTGITGRVTIRTRTETVDMPPTLPIHIYAFDESGKCAAVQTLMDVDADISLELTVGMYTIYALTGASAEDYDLPAQTNAKPGDLITLKAAGKHHSELEAGKATITLTDGGTTELMLTVTRLVAGITARIADVKEDVTAVGLTLQPMHSGVSLDGTYAEGSAASPPIALNRSSSSGVWEASWPVFVLPGKERTTVTISITDASGTRSYAYNSDIRIEANYKIVIEATYDESTGPDINGTINSTDWAGQKTISFNFGPGGSSGKDNEGNLPAVGDIYKGCYVLEVTGSNILLVAPEQWENLSIDQSASAISGYEVEGISGWRLPDSKEAELIYKAAAKIPGMDKANEYLFLDGDVHRCFDYYENSFAPRKAMATGKYYLKVVKIVEL